MTSGVCVGGGGWVGGGAYVCVLRIVSMDKILCFTNTLIIVMLSQQYEYFLSQAKQRRQCEVVQSFIVSLTCSNWHLWNSVCFATPHMETCSAPGERHLSPGWSFGCCWCSRCSTPDAELHHGPTAQQDLHLVHTPRSFPDPGRCRAGYGGWQNPASWWVHWAVSDHLINYLNLMPSWLEVISGWRLVITVLSSVQVCFCALGQAHMRGWPSSLLQLVLQCT